MKEIKEEQDSISPMVSFGRPQETPELLVKKENILIQKEEKEDLMHTIRDETFSESELFTIFKLTEESDEFKVGRFLLITFYHLSSNIFGAPIGIFLMWVCEGFSLTLARNMLFYGNTPAAYGQGFLNSFIPLNLYFLMK